LVQKSQTSLNYAYVFGYLLLYAVVLWLLYKIERFDLSEPLLVLIVLGGMRAAGVFYFGGIALHGTDVWKWATIYGFVFILVALREEFRARGYGLFTLSAGIGFWPAAILWAACFGYSHHGNSGEDWVGLFNAGAFGLLACFLLRRTGNLWMPSGVHMAFDRAKPISTAWPTGARYYPVIF